MKLSFRCFYRSFLLKVIVAATSFLFGIAPAFSQNQSAQARAARKACLNGDYAKGVSILSDLFLDTKDPTFIYNQGRCFEQSRRFEDAVSRFEEYLRVAEGKLKPEDKAEAEKHLSTCQTQLAKERGSSVVQPPPAPVLPIAPPPAPDPASTATGTPETSAATLVESPPKSASEPPRWGMVTAGIISGAVGVGGVVTGILFQLKANNAINDMETKTGAYSIAKQDDQKGYKTTSMIGYGAGAACVVVGAILIGFGLKSGDSSPTNVAFAPVVGPGQVGASLTGGF